MAACRLMMLHVTSKKLFLNSYNDSPDEFMQYCNYIIVFGIFTGGLVFLTNMIMLSSHFPY